MGEHGSLSYSDSYNGFAYGWSVQEMALKKVLLLSFLILSLFINSAFSIHAIPLNVDYETGNETELDGVLHSGSFTTSTHSASSTVARNGTYSQKMTFGITGTQSFYRHGILAYLNMNFSGISEYYFNISIMMDGCSGLIGQELGIMFLTNGSTPDFDTSGWRNIQNLIYYVILKQTNPADWFQDWQVRICNGQTWFNGSDTFDFASWSWLDFSIHYRGSEETTQVFMNNILYFNTITYPSSALTSTTYLLYGYWITNYLAGSWEQIFYYDAIRLYLPEVIEPYRQVFNEGWYNFGIGFVGVGLIFAGFVFMKIAWMNGEYDKAIAFPLICWVIALGLITVLVGA